MLLFTQSFLIRKSLSSQMLKKILAAGSINVANSLISFLITLVIVHRAGVGIVGELYVLLASCALIMLLNILLPASYSLVKIQNSQIFSKVLFAQYFYVQFIIFFVAFFLFRSDFGWAAFVIALYCCFSSWLNYFDILLQSKGLIKDFYLATFLGNLVKVLSLMMFTSTEMELTKLVALLTVGQFSSLMLMVFFNIKNGRFVLFSFSIRRLIKTYVLNFSQIKGFYLTAIFKRLFDNLPALLFGGTVSSNTMGAFAIYQKSLVFGISFIRILESLLLHKTSSSLLTSKVNMLVIVGSVFLTFFASIIYCSLTIGVNVGYSLLMSMLILPIFASIEIRSRFIKLFSMMHVNIAMLLSMAAMFLISQFIFNGELLSMFIAYAVMLTVQALWLLFAFLRIKND